MEYAARDESRRLARRPREELAGSLDTLELEAGEEESPDSALVRSENVELLRNAVNELPAPAGAALRLRALDVPWATLARVTGVREPQLRQKYRDAKDRLKSRLVDQPNLVPLPSRSRPRVRFERQARAAIAIVRVAERFASPDGLIELRQLVARLMTLDYVPAATTLRVDPPTVAIELERDDYRRFVQMVARGDFRGAGILVARADKLLGMADSNQRVAVIVTALSEEFRAVRSFLTDVQILPAFRGFVFESGTFCHRDRNWRIIVVESGKGNTKAALAANAAIESHAPEVAMFVGIAGGIKDVRKGDIVVATKVYGYQSGADKDVFEPRPDVFVSAHKLEQQARTEARNQRWLELIKEPDVVPAVVVAPLAAGEVVVKSHRSATYAFLRAAYGDAVAVEMEGKGLLEAAHISNGTIATVVRGISDLIEDKEPEADVHWQPTAATNAAAFALAILAFLDR
jgi:nucleoside phosphorylase